MSRRLTRCRVRGKARLGDRHSPRPDGKGGRTVYLWPRRYVPHRARARHLHPRRGRFRGRVSSVAQADARFGPARSVRSGRTPLRHRDPLTCRLPWPSRGQTARSSQVIERRAPRQRSAGSVGNPVHHEVQGRLKAALDWFASGKGFVGARRHQRAIVSIAKESSSTCLPLNRSPNR